MSTIREILLRELIKDQDLHLMYGEDLPEGIIRKQVEDLRKRLDPSIYRAKKVEKAKIK